MSHSKEEETLESTRVILDILDGVKVDIQYMQTITSNAIKSDSVSKLETYTKDLVLLNTNVKDRLKYLIKELAGYKKSLCQSQSVTSSKK